MKLFWNMFDMVLLSIALFAMFVVSLILQGNYALYQVGFICIWIIDAILLFRRIETAYDETDMTLSTDVDTIKKYRVYCSPGGYWVIEAYHMSDALYIGQTRIKADPTVTLPGFVVYAEPC